jgi:hypothetical protein
MEDIIDIIYCRGKNRKNHEYYRKLLHLFIQKIKFADGITRSR